MVKKAPSSFDKIGVVPSASVKKFTGKDWDTWVECLNRAGGRAMSYQELVAFVVKKYKLSLWWRHGVVQGYEIAIGRRVFGQDAKGRYSLAVTKTLKCSRRALWNFLHSIEGKALWLNPLFPVELLPKAHFETRDGVFGQVRTLRAGERMRLRWEDSDWADPTVLMVFLVSRPGDKCVLVFQHQDIASAAIKGKLRAKWKKAAEAIAAAMCPDGLSN